MDHSIVFVTWYPYVPHLIHNSLGAYLPPPPVSQLVHQIPWAHGRVQHTDTQTTLLESEQILVLILDHTRSTVDQIGVGQFL